MLEHPRSQWNCKYMSYVRKFFRKTNIFYSLIVKECKEWKPCSFIFRPFTEIYSSHKIPYSQIKWVNTLMKKEAFYYHFKKRQCITFRLQEIERSCQCKFLPRLDWLRKYIDSLYHIPINNSAKHLWWSSLEKIVNGF